MSEFWAWYIMGYVLSLFISLFRLRKTIVISELFGIVFLSLLSWVMVFILLFTGLIKEDDDNKFKEF